MTKKRGSTGGFGGLKTVVMKQEKKAILQEQRVVMPPTDLCISTSLELGTSIGFGGLGIWMSGL